MLFKREILITYDLKKMNEIREKLSEKGIKTYVSCGSYTANGRQHGVPFINSDYSYGYRIYVKFKDYKKAVYILKVSS